MPDHATANRVQPWLDDGDVQLYHGDALTVLQGLPSGIVQTAITSPPYWGLRCYGVDGQMGLEETPDEYVENMVNLFREVRRVLRDDGTLWLNIGDSYWNGGGEKRDGGHGFVDGGKPKLEAAKGSLLQRRSSDDTFGLKPKDLVGIPWRIAFALQNDGWYLRSDIIWSKPNPMPESVTDRPTKAHEYVFLFSKQPRYFYDADAIREPHETPPELRRNPTPKYDPGLHRGPDMDEKRLYLSNRGGNELGYPQAGRNRRSVWTIPTEPFPEAHFATYPQELVRPCILAGTSERGECVECGTPWRRQTERVDTGQRQKMADGWDTGAGGHGTIHRNGRERGEAGIPIMVPQTTGWEPTCSCVDSQGGRPLASPQIVLDPFVGSGTTALVARKHGRRCIGIDLSSDYLAIAAKRTQQLSLLGGVA